jgi:HEAT repeat protein
MPGGEKGGIVMNKTSWLRAVVLVVCSLAVASSLARAADPPTYKGQTAAQWEAALASSRRMEVSRALQDGDPAALGVLLELAKSPQTVVRLVALGGLAELKAAELGAQAKDAVPILAAALADKNLNARYFAASTLQKIGPLAASAVPALIKALSTHPATEPGLDGPPRYYQDARSVAADALGSIGPAAKAAVGRLREVAARDEAPEVRGAATEALKKIEAAK